MKNSLAKYDEVRGQMRGGDMIAYGGTGFLSRAIEVVTGSVLSHMAMVVAPELTTAGNPDREIFITESTITPGQNGPQINPLRESVAVYPGKVWWLPLSDRIRSFLNFDDMWALMLKKIGPDRYNVLELGKYLARYVPGVNMIPWLYRVDPGYEVCEEYLCMLLAAGGLPGLNPAVMPPQKGAELKIYREAVQLVGVPTRIRSFNSV